MYTSKSPARDISAVTLFFSRSSSEKYWKLQIVWVHWHPFSDPCPYKKSCAAAKRHGKQANIHKHAAVLLHWASKKICRGVNENAESLFFVWTQAVFRSYTTATRVRCMEGSRLGCFEFERETVQVPVQIFKWFLNECIGYALPTWLVSCMTLNQNQPKQNRPSCAYNSVLQAYVAICAVSNPARDCFW
jgi:hypothetical protein